MIVFVALGELADLLLVQLLDRRDLRVDEYEERTVDGAGGGEDGAREVRRDRDGALLERLYRQTHAAG